MRILFAGLIPVIALLINFYSSTSKTDYEGKCFIYERKYRDPATYLVFNENGDYVFFIENRIHGPLESYYKGSDKPVDCPTEVYDRFGITTIKLKNHGVYEDVKKYINIIVN